MIPKLDEFTGYCLTFNQTFCDASYYTSFFGGGEGGVGTICAECSLECNIVDYQLTTSAASYPTTQIYNRLITKTNILSQFNNDASTITYDKLKNRVLGISVYYEVRVSLSFNFYVSNGIFKFHHNFNLENELHTNNSET